jgi:hypothetical protein
MAELLAPRRDLAGKLAAVSQELGQGLAGRADQRVGAGRANAP